MHCVLGSSNNKLSPFQKSIAKRFFSVLFDALTFPFFVYYLLIKAIFNKKKAITFTTQSLSLVPGVSGEWARRGILRWITKKPLNDCCISFGTTFSDPRVIIEDGVYIGTRCDIGWAHIGKDTIIGSGVHILSGLGQHRFDDLKQPIKDQPGVYEKVVIGEGSWIGNGAIVGANVGKGCVVGAGSVVIKALEDFSIAAGNPARVIRKRK